MKPVRVQLQRTKGWRMPPNTVKVDRSTKWGNPFPAQSIGLDLSLKLFSNAVSGYWDPGVITPDWPTRRFVQLYQAQKAWRDRLHGHVRETIRRELRGKNLACWCKPGARCHADILLRIANEQ